LPKANKIAAFPNCAIPAKGTKDMFLVVIFISQFGLGAGSDRGGDVSIHGRADSTRASGLRQNLPSEVLVSPFQYANLSRYNAAR
jgi:hypothetical protein